MGILKSLVNAGLTVIDALIGVLDIASNALKRAHDALSGFVNDLKMQ